MALVWAARMKGSRGFQKLVAVKSMLPALSDDAQFEEMFLAEAGLASRIRHPHVAEILDLGDDDGKIYIVMEWVDGEPLSAIQKAARAKGGIPIPIAARIACHAAQGLHAAHELKKENDELVGLVHRDVSPQNILVTYDGVVKIVDFGVAKATREAEQSMTRVGQVKGKVPFMSPEQTRGRPIDRRTDVFALGIVLYQMVTGKHPFRGDNDMATLHQICDPSPVAAPITIAPRCPPALDAAIRRALEKDPEKRFPDMLELARALERVLADLGAADEMGDDIATFVRGVVGHKAERRRAALKEAIQLADEKLEHGRTSLASAPTGRASGDDPLAASGISQPSIVSGAPPSGRSAPQTPAGFAVPEVAPASARSRGGRMFPAFVTMVGVAVVGSLFVARDRVETWLVGPPPGPVTAPVVAAAAPMPSPEPVSATTARAADSVSAVPTPTATASAEPDKREPVSRAPGGATARRPVKAGAAQAPSSTPQPPKILSPGF